MPGGKASSATSAQIPDCVGALRVLPAQRRAVRAGQQDLWAFAVEQDYPLTGCWVLIRVIGVRSRAGV